MRKLTSKSQFKDGMIVVHRFNEDITGFSCAGCIQRVTIRKDGSVLLFRYKKNMNNSCRILVGSLCHELNMRMFAYAVYEEVVNGVLTIGDI